MAAGIENGPGMYDGLFDFNQDGKLNILEKSAEMDYFAEQVERVSSLSEQQCDEAIETSDENVDDQGNPVDAEKMQVKLTHEFVKNENSADETQGNNAENDLLDISVSPEVIQQIYNMATGGDSPS
ncbi:MAG: hypothetical protein K6B67_02125 [Lachnospiraceae bacterium]|nr:hypothetical protein [Lachnospiraceae bacterium]